MKKFIDLIIVSKDDKILIRRLRFGNTWEFIKKVLRKDESWSEKSYLYASQNFKIQETKVIKLGRQEFEEEDMIVEFWVIKVKYPIKTPWSLLYNYKWVEKEDAVKRTRLYGPDVFYYIQKYFDYVNY